ncbi:hypothetical protein BD770DRAFT_449664 [Pilaira anomala]|nr:hypothetical protein BD770DRAFT_449664 [Pilaira anomala]
MSISEILIELSNDPEVTTERVFDTIFNHIRTNEPGIFQNYQWPEQIIRQPQTLNDILNNREVSTEQVFNEMFNHIHTHEPQFFDNYQWPEQITRRSRRTETEVLPINLENNNQKIRVLLTKLKTIEESDFMIEPIRTQIQWDNIDDMLNLISTSKQQFDLMKPNRLIDDFKTCFIAINYFHAFQFVNDTANSIEQQQNRDKIKKAHVHNKLIRIGKRATQLITSFRTFTGLVIIIIITMVKLNRASKPSFDEFMINLNQQIDQNTQIIRKIRKSKISLHLLHIFGRNFPPALHIFLPNENNDSSTDESSTDNNDSSSSDEDSGNEGNTEQTVTPNIQQIREQPVENIIPETRRETAHNIQQDITLEARRETDQDITPNIEQNIILETRQETEQDFTLDIEHDNILESDQETNIIPTPKNNQIPETRYETQENTDNENTTDNNRRKRKEYFSSDIADTVKRRNRK